MDLLNGLRSGLGVGGGHATQLATNTTAPTCPRGHGALGLTATRAAERLVDGRASASPTGAAALTQEDHFATQFLRGVYCHVCLECDATRALKYYSCAGCDFVECETCFGLGRRLYVLELTGFVVAPGADDTAPRATSPTSFHSAGLVRVRRAPQSSSAVQACPGLIDALTVPLPIPLAHDAHHHGPLAVVDDWVAVFSGGGELAGVRASQQLGPRVPFRSFLWSSRQDASAKAAITLGAHVPGSSSTTSSTDTLPNSSSWAMPARFELPGAFSDAESKLLWFVVTVAQDDTASAGKKPALAVYGTYTLTPTAGGMDVVTGLGTSDKTALLMKLRTSEVLVTLEKMANDSATRVEAPPVFPLSLHGRRPWESAPHARDRARNKKRAVFLRLVLKRKLRALHLGDMGLRLFIQITNGHVSDSMMFSEERGDTVPGFISFRELIYCAQLSELTYYSENEDVHDAVDAITGVLDQMWLDSALEVTKTVTDARLLDAGLGGSVSRSAGPVVVAAVAGDDDGAAAAVKPVDEGAGAAVAVLASRIREVAAFHLTAKPGEWAAADARFAGDPHWTAFLTRLMARFQQDPTSAMFGRPMTPTEGLGRMRLVAVPAAAFSPKTSKALVDDAVTRGRKDKTEAPRGSGDDEGAAANASIPRGLGAGGSGAVVFEFGDVCLHLAVSDGFADRGGDLVIAFRGTVFSEVRNILRDMRGFAFPFQPLYDTAEMVPDDARTAGAKMEGFLVNNAKYAAETFNAVTNFFYDMLDDAGKELPLVHAGYYKALLRFKDVIREALRWAHACARDKPVRIVLTGHSLGGGLAFITMAWFLEWFKQAGDAGDAGGDDDFLAHEHVVFPSTWRLLCVTFGQPKVLSRTVISSVDKHPLMRRTAQFADGQQAHELLLRYGVAGLAGRVRARDRPAARVSRAACPGQAGRRRVVEAARALCG